MSHRRISKGKAVLAGAGAVGVAAAAILLPNANASQSGTDDGAGGAGQNPRTVSAASAPEIVARLSDQLGEDYAGAWYDTQKKQVVVNVADGGGESAARVRRGRRGQKRAEQYG